MLTKPELLIFLTLTIISALTAWNGFRAVGRVIRRSRGVPPTRREIALRFSSALRRWLVEPSIWQARPVSSFFHFLLALGFIFYLIVNGGDVYYGITGNRIGDGSLLGAYYRLLTDLLTVAVLVAMGYFLVRRFLAKDRRLEYRSNIPLLPSARRGAVQRDSLIVGIFILLHVGSRYVGESFHLAAIGSDPYQPFASALSILWLEWPMAWLIAGEHFAWWMAIGLIVLFVPYFPYTKHFHLIMSGVNFLTKPERASLAAIEAIDLEADTEHFGAARLEELPYTLIVDAYACVMCNRCQDVCPAYQTGKELSPAALEVNKRLYLNECSRSIASGASSQKSLLDFAISPSAVWACTMCGACAQICPVGNEPVLDIVEIRRHEVLTAEPYPQPLQRAYHGMQRNGNPWSLPSAERMNWADGMQVPTVHEITQPEILWWVGCAPSYDTRARNVARAFAAILTAANVRYAVLGELEKCTGDSARRTGNEYLFQQLAEQNIDTLNKLATTRIVTTCPHCAHTLGEEYRAFGGTYDVVHYTQYLFELFRAGRLQLQSPAMEETVTYHDPCMLGRYHGVVQEPRDLLTHLNVRLAEMQRSRMHTFCCGAGGGQMWKEEEPGDQPVSGARYAEASQTKAQTLAVACPFCHAMLADAKAEVGDGPEVRDLAELVVERLA